MVHRPTHSRFYHALLVLALLSNLLTPVAQAQSITPLYLPIIANGNAAPQTDLLFRTHITVQTPGQWRDLHQMEIVILEQGDDWATVLVDDMQLTDLARWRFSPTSTDTLEALVAANTVNNNTTAASFQPLLGEIAATKARLQIDAAATTDIRANLRAALQDLSSEQQTFLLAATSVDTDSDGLNDTLEGYWCTDPARADTDFDGVNDGTEVQRLKDWMDNKLSKAPSSAKPFQGWPPQKTNCYDDDLDSVPDVVEVLELGLDLNQESTDRDKFDDGQELFGTTYCPGSAGFCGYGVRPRNEDWGTITAQMPSWVKAPGHHPLVAAYPEPEIDVMESSFRVQLVTTITDGQTTLTGTEKSYSTSATEGTSTSLANTETWNKWQETSKSTPLVYAGSIDPELQSSAISKRGVERLVTTAKKEAVAHGVDRLIDGGIDCVGSLFSEGMKCLSGIKTVASRVSKDYSTVWNDLKDPNLDLLTKSLATLSCVTPISCRIAAATLHPDDTEHLLSTSSTEEGQDRAISGEGHMYSIDEGSSIFNMKRMFDLSFPINKPMPTLTETEGSAQGGARTETHTQYEEHTVTNGEAFLSQESWSKATAIDSAHAADLWFTYKVSNPGTEYAREIANLTFNIYIGDDPNPVYTYFVAPDIGGGGKLQNFMPNEEHLYTSRRVPLSLDMMKLIDLGAPIRVVVEDFTYGIDELFYQDATNASVLIALEDSVDDGNEVIDSYLIPTWGSETVLNVVARYFPHETDSTGTITAIWTPEYRSDNPGWCQSPQRPTDQPTKVIWCKHTLSTADWWNVYTDGLGDGSEGLQDTQAVPGSVALFRFNKDTDLDGFSDRSETQLGTDPNDASSFPRPEVLAGIHNIRSGNRVTSTLSLLNSGIYDAYGVEAVMIAPDDSVSITNNTVGGSGRVRALKQVIVGSSVQLQTPLPAAWTQANHATPGVGGYYTGPQDRTYTFTVTDCPVGGCAVGSGTWKLNWNDGRGATGQLAFSANYQSPNFQAVGAFGLTLALYSGTVANGESFTVSARTPRDTFQYTINRQPYTEPLVIVSYNDPQGNHRFVLPSAAMSLTQPTANLQQLAGTMLDDVGVEIVTSRPITVGVNSATLLVNNPSDKTLQNAHLFLEVINISGTVVAEVPTQVNLPPGPKAVPVSFNTGAFSPAYLPADDYIVMAFLTDYQGNILDTAGRPLSSFQVDPLPTLSADDSTLTWDIGTVTQGTLLKHDLALANTGFGRLYTYIPPSSGLALHMVGSRTVGAADQPSYELTLRTADLPVGAYDQTITLATSDPANPTRSLRVYGAITAASGDTSGGVLQRPLDFAVTVPGSHSQGEWVDFIHNLGPEPQTLHPIKVYSQDYSTLYGVGKYATAFGQGTASYDMFGDGRDGVMPSSGNLDYAQGFGIGIINGAAGSTIATVADRHAVGRINPGDVVLIHQTRGGTTGVWELNKAVSDFTGDGTYTFEKPLQHTYITTGGIERAQILRVPQYTNCPVTGTVTSLSTWNGDWGGIFAVICNGTMNITGSIGTVGYGYRGGSGSYVAQAQQGEGENGLGGLGRNANGAGGGGGGNGPSWGYGGTAYQVNPELTTHFAFGGGGGGGNANTLTGGVPGSTGGAGGGLIYLSASTLSVSGTINASGQNGAGTNNGRSGGGAGGAIILKTRTSTIGNNRMLALGGAGVTGLEGDGGGGGGGAVAGADGNHASSGGGGVGRIRIEYCETLTGGTNPSASTQKLDCYLSEQIETAPYTSARLSLPESFINQRTYNLQFGHKLNFTATGEQSATLRIPTGLVANSTLDVLLNNAGTGDLALKLDIGNNGSWDWESTQNVTNAAIFSSPDLSVAFNQYWSSHGSPTTGNIEIPVKLWLSKAATAFITNLQQLNLTASGVSSALDPKPLDVTVAITGSHTAGEWIQFTHNLGLEPQSLQPAKVYNHDYSTLYGMGKYATAFGQGTFSYDMFGDGRDGVMPSSGNLDNDNGTGFGIVNSGSAGAMNITVTDAYGVARINPGDVVLIHQTQGTNAGCWELNKAISDFAGNPTTNTYQLTKPLQCNYNSSGNNKAQIMRVPQYSTCNVTGTVAPLTAWNGNWAGIFAVMCNGTMNISGSINASAHGFRSGSGGVKGSTSGQIGNQGESINGTGNRNWPANGAAGGGGEGDYWPNSGPIGKGGGGGSYQGTGGNGGHDRTNPVLAQSGNGIGGTADLSTIFLGSGGGGGGADADANAQSTAPSGGVGGGIAIVLAKELQVTGSILVNGNNGGNSGNWTGGGGGGSGGAAKIIASTFQSTGNLVQATGGIGGRNTNEPNSGEMIGGNGGIGRIRVEYCESLIGTTNPPASTQKLNCYITEQVETAPYNTARLNLPESFSDGRTYKVQFGRKLDFITAGTQITTLRIPAGLYNSVQLDALVSDLPANATLTLDVGNDGSTEWSSTVANNSTTTSADLAAAFTAYWRSQGSPTTGTLDVPIKVTTTQPGQVLLTNLQVSATGSRLRYVRVPFANYTSFLLDFTAGNGGTVALDLGDNGTIDWSASLDAPRQLTANLKDALNAYLAGKSGDVEVPLRFYLSPLHPITLNDYQVTIASNLDLLANSITVGSSAVTAASADNILIDAGSTATVQATLRNGSSSASGPVTAAFFATATGWGDWYIGSAFVANIAATGNVTVTIPWNTTGFSGTVPVKVVINPYRHVGETNYNNNTKSTTVAVNPPPVLPAAPTGLVATMAATNRINLTWADASSNENDFKVERSLTGVSGWTQIATVGAGVTTYASIGLACGKAYFYRVRATNSNGDSAFSNVATALTRLCQPTLQPLTAITQIQLTLLWTDNNSNESGFKIERSATGATPWSQIATVGANVTTYTNNGLNCGTPYHYRVRAYTGSNNSAYSAIVNATTTICAPVAPTLLAATAISATQINLSWTDASSNESGFKVERSPDGVNGWTLLTTVGAGVTTYADSGLACATAYHYRVRATNAGGDSPNSNIATATTPACLPDLIFADGFESSNLLAWSARAIGGGDLRTSATAALVGSQGMEAVINDNIAMYVTDQRPEAESRYRARFYFDPNSMVMTSGDAHFIFYGYQGTTPVVLRVEFRRLNSSYQLRAAALNDPPTTGAATWRTTSFFTISDAPHFLEVDWQAATAPGDNNGSLTFWIDGAQRALLTALDNDTRRIDLARLGSIAGIDTGTRGTYFFDAFESRRRTYIGPVSGSALAADLTTATETLTTTVGTLLATSALHAGEATTLVAEVSGLGVQIAFPAVGSSETISAQIRVTDTQTLPDGYTLLGEMMTVQTSALVTQPVTMTITYGAAATDALTTTISLQRWNPGAEQWEALSAQVNPDTQTVSVTIDVPATVALWQPETEALPTESVEENAAPEETAAPAAFSTYLPLVQR